MPSIHPTAKRATQSRHRPDELPINPQQVGATAHEIADELELTLDRIGALLEETLVCPYELQRDAAARLRKLTRDSLTIANAARVMLYLDDLTTEHQTFNQRDSDAVQRVFLRGRREHKRRRGTQGRQRTPRRQARGAAKRGVA